MSSGAGSVSKATKHYIDFSPDRAIKPEGIDSSANFHADVLSRKQFLDQLHREQRRADRSHAPLSLVVINFASDESLDIDDLRGILSGLSMKKRDTDFIGDLGDGLVAFLLPYSGAKAAEAFSKLIVHRLDLPAVTVDFATYTEARFDDFVRDWLTRTEAVPVFGELAARKSRWALVIKRGMDVVGALFLIAVCAPLMIIAAIAIKLSSPGPVIFRQMRVGRGGIPFEFYKFRSMRVDSDDRVHREYVTKLIAGRHHEINEGDSEKPVYKLRSDSRVTSVGRYLRRTSIDELPQLFNVLKGEMSLVGPRPPISYETENYQSWHMRRLQEVRPGITGLWQVEGRSKTSFDDMVRLDLRYIRNWSLWLDVKILLKTIIVVVRRDGAD